jgi:nitrogen regulatory protein P-II 1
MKFVIAIVKPFNAGEVVAAVAKSGVDGMTVEEVKGFGRQKGQTEFYRFNEYSSNLLPKVKLEIAAADEAAGRAIEAIIESAKTGKIGDGKVFVLPLEQLVRIQDDERGEAAV